MLATLANTPTTSNLQMPNTNNSQQPENKQPEKQKNPNKIFHIFSTWTQDVLLSLFGLFLLHFRRLQRQCLRGSGFARPPTLRCHGGSSEGHGAMSDHCQLVEPWRGCRDLLFLFCLFLGCFKGGLQNQWANVGY